MQRYYWDVFIFLTNHCQIDGTFLLNANLWCSHSMFNSFGTGNVQHFRNKSLGQVFVMLYPLCLVEDMLNLFFSFTPTCFNGITFVFIVVTWMWMCDMLFKQLMLWRTCEWCYRPVLTSLSSLTLFFLPFSFVPSILFLILQGAFLY